MLNYKSDQKILKDRVFVELLLKNESTLLESYEVRHILQDYHLIIT